MTKKIEEIIEKSYSIFGTYKVTKPLDVCTTCCLTDSQENDLVSLGVRYIPFELLYKYNTAAKTAKPNINEFKHFLPRFLELTTQLKFLSHSAELSFSRFDYYDECEWKQVEKDILSDFSIEFFRYCLTIYPLPELERIDSIIVMLSKAYIDIYRILSLWKETSTKESVLHLSDLVNNGFEEHKPNELKSPFDKLGLGGRIAMWLNTTKFSEGLSSTIEEIIMNPENIENYTLTELSVTYDVVRMKNAL